VPLKSYHVSVELTLFSAAEKMTLACLYCLARKACEFCSILLSENFCKNDFVIYGNFAEGKDCFAIISFLKGKQGALPHRAERSVSTFSWPQSCADFLLCTPALQFQGLPGLSGF